MCVALINQPASGCRRRQHLAAAIQLRHRLAAQLSNQSMSILSVLCVCMCVGLWHLAALTQRQPAGGNGGVNWPKIFSNVAAYGSQLA